MTELNTEIGFISMRNEDGTQWYTKVYGMNCWGDSRAERRAFPHSVYADISASVEASKKDDCPDNGFFGIYNLTWTPCTHDEAHEQEIMADAAQREREAEDDEPEEYDDENDTSDMDEDGYVVRQMEAYDMWRNEY